MGHHRRKERAPGEVWLPRGFGPIRTIRGLKELMQRPEIRLKETFGEVERKAGRSAKKDEILVFGHTHRSFVNKKENVVNTGSWVSESRTPNTYVELHPEGISLKIFKGEITERT
jgi:predicted phosphodiesterase